MNSPLYSKKTGKLRVEENSSKEMGSENQFHSYNIWNNTWARQSITVNGQ